MYPIKKVVSMTGINAMTLRAWERRYQPIEPKRDSNGYRSYSLQDIDKLTLMVKAKEQGHSISQISKLSIAELKTLLKEPDAILKKPIDNSYNQLINEIIEALENYQVIQYEELINRSFIAVDLLVFITEIISPLLNKVGEKWASNEISITQEHMISACIRHLLICSINHFSTNQYDHCDFLFATPPKEDHDLGILICHLMAAKQNFNCRFVGANLPLDELQPMFYKIKPRVIVLGLTNMPTNSELMTQLQETIEILSKENTEIWLGGCGAEHLFDYEQFPNCILINNFHEFNQLLTLKSRGDF